MFKHFNLIYGLLIVLFSCSLATAQKEDFESGSKNGYATDNVSLVTGKWELSDALIGNDNRDVKNGNKSVRLKDGGKITMKFDVTANGVSIGYGAYDTDKKTAFEVWTSTDGGTTWKKAGVVSALGSQLKTANFGIKGKVRLEIRNTSASGARINIDDIAWGESGSSNNSTPTPPTDNNSTTNNSSTNNNAVVAAKDNSHLLLGNPSNAQTNTNSPDNYLIVRDEYVLSYNKSRGTANWVAWHLNKSWKGDAPRSEGFKPDPLLPPSFYAVTTKDYANSGFDRGHLCPSDDRDKSVATNEATFYMTNIVPQTSDNNKEVWRQLEEYARKLVENGKELYIIAGVYGKGGTDKDGRAKSTIGNGVVVPARIWKIIVVLDDGNNDLQRINESTRVIAIDTPNQRGVDQKRWTEYRVSVRAIEKATGYDFLSNLPKKVQDVIESQVDRVSDK
jgi:endonuclease G